MKTSDRGLNLIKSFEGCKLTAYKDAVGVLTIGYGHTSGVKAGDKITQAKADEYLKSDVVTSENAVNKMLTKYKLNQNEFDALVSFTFNLGSKNLLKLTNNYRRNKGEIADAILLYNKAGGNVLKGLIKRRQAERDLFCSSPTTAPKVEKENPYTIPKVTLKKGSKGVGVKWLQWELNESGYNLTIDGVFGDKTLDAVKSFQHKHGLVIDGLVGKNTRAKLLEV